MPFLLSVRLRGRTIDAKRMAACVAVMIVCATALRADVLSTPVSEITFSNMPLERVLTRLSTETSVTVAACGKTASVPVSVCMRNITLQQALDQLVAKKPDWMWLAPPDRKNRFEIWDQASFRAQVQPKQVEQRVFVLRNNSSEEACKAVRGFVTPDLGKVSYDIRTNKMFVTDLPEALKNIEKVVREIDVPFEMRVFKVSKADAVTVAAHLATLKSPAAPVPIGDSRTQQIIVHDRADVLKKMEEVLRILDVSSASPRAAASVYPAPQTDAHAPADRKQPVAEQ